MNQNENKIKKLYEQLGFEVIPRGAPDFLIFRRDGNGVMRDIEFIEVKRDIHDRLKPDQELWKEALETLFCEYKVLSSTENLSPYNPDKELARFTCRNCNKESIVSKRNILSELRRLRGIDKQNLIVR